MSYNINTLQDSVSVFEATILNVMGIFWKYMKSLQIYFFDTKMLQIWFVRRIINYTCLLRKQKTGKQLLYLSEESHPLPHFPSFLRRPYDITQNRHQVPWINREFVYNSDAALHLNEFTKHLRKL